MNHTLSPNAAKIRQMLELQNVCNTRIDGEDWIAKGRPFYRAAWMEAAELLDHSGWKWWKATEADVAQIQMEAVDIWHFALSDWIIRYCPVLEMSDEFCETVARVLSREENGLDLTAFVEIFISKCTSTGAITVDTTVPLVLSTGLDLDSLFKMYIGKNALNRFRQDNGYATGGYIKIWAGEEDNVHLAKILDNSDGSSDTFYDDVMQQLIDCYGALAKAS